MPDRLVFDTLQPELITFELHHTSYLPIVIDSKLDIATIALEIYFDPIGDKSHPIFDDLDKSTFYLLEEDEYS